MEKEQIDYLLNELKAQQLEIKEDIKELVQARLDNFKREILEHIDDKLEHINERLNLVQRESALTKQEIGILSDQVQEHAGILKEHGKVINELKVVGATNWDKNIQKLFQKLLIAAVAFMLLNVGIITAIIIYVLRK